MHFLSDEMAGEAETTTPTLVVSLHTMPPMTSSSSGSSPSNSTTFSSIVAPAPFQVGSAAIAYSPANCTISSISDQIADDLHQTVSNIVWNNGLLSSVTISLKNTCKNTNEETLSTTINVGTIIDCDSNHFPQGFFSAVWGVDNAQCKEPTSITYTPKNIGTTDCGKLVLGYTDLYGTQCPAGTICSTKDNYYTTIWGSVKGANCQAQTNLVLTTPCGQPVEGTNLYGLACQPGYSCAEPNSDKGHKRGEIKASSSVSICQPYANIVCGEGGTKCEEKKLCVLKSNQSFQCNSENCVYDNLSVCVNAP